MRATIGPVRSRFARILVLLPPAALAILLLGSDPAQGQRGLRSRASRFYHSSPANILRGQLALAKAGHLEGANCEPGRYDAATREALRDFQRRHRLDPTGRLDFDTFALLPIDTSPDADDDGIPDAGDRCPSTAKGTRVGFDGCLHEKKPPR
jgi:hypothetical protein